MLPFIKLKFEVQCARHEILATSACSVIAGTYVERKMEQFMCSPASNKTDIDALVLFEQRVNLMNGPIILMQIVRVLVPLDFTNRYREFHLVMRNIFQQLCCIQILISARQDCNMLHRGRQKSGP